MKFGMNFSALLSAVVLAISLGTSSEARPAPSGSGLVTVPVTRIHKPVYRDAIDTQAIHQHHANRGSQRLALMSGHLPVAPEELQEIHRRTGELPAGLSKRYFREGVVKFLEDLKTQMKGSSSAMSKAESFMDTDAAGGFNPKNVDAANENTLTPANAPSSNNSLGLDISANDIGYLATIQIGTPPRAFKMLVDSGSSDLWVGGENCSGSSGAAGCGNHTFIGSGTSSSFSDTGKTWSITYGSGSLSGNIVQDDIEIAGMKLSAHKFGAAKNESSQFSGNDTLFDGIMGLGGSQLSDQGFPTVVEALHSAGLIQAPITSYKLARLADGSNDGEITFGGMDPAKFNASTKVTIKNVSPKGYWEANVDTFKVDGKDINLSGRTAILDTGTSLIVGPGNDVDALHEAMPVSRFDGFNWIIPCTTTSKVAFTFSGREFTVDTRDLTFLPVNSTNLTGDCYSSITRGSVGGDQEWLFGDVFLKNVYFSTDVGSNQISLANLA
ncbi:acid protease [Neolentinus lepideus HHB14362 ss-1]|uniref:Acid protease n=1 Tax=Neolentinus lepideus HHB14362 ss-1 TaxID=1314782 RepID=A0A165VMS9_9AGAM|nr:acid protease [Neolentinus lepideus HHB14362 ss-1]